MTIRAVFLFDDVRGILRNEECVNLLMALAENKPKKIVEWNVASRSKSDDLREASVVTTSRMVLLLNDARENDESLAPIFSRSVLAEFRPSKREAHEYIGKWFLTDERREDVYAYIGKYLQLVPQVDARDYLKATGLYDMDRQDYLHQTWSGDEHQSAALKIINDPSIPVGEALVKKFAELCRGSRATFFRAKAKLMPMDSEEGTTSGTHAATSVSKSHFSDYLTKPWMNNRVSSGPRRPRLCPDARVEPGKGRGHIAVGKIAPDFFRACKQAMRAWRKSVNHPPPRAPPQLSGRTQARSRIASSPP